MTFDKSPLYKLYVDEKNNNIYIKREDLLPFSFGGNKLRIALEFFEDMQKQGKNHMIAYGGPRSNLCRVIANLSNAKGIPCTIISPPDDSDVNIVCNNFSLSKSFGAEIVKCSKENVAQAVQTTMQKSLDIGLKPYYINGNSKGRGNEAVPVAAYAKAYLEILEQEKELKTKFNSIFLACGTAMTFSGLLAGKIINRTDHDIYAISVARKNAEAFPYVKRYLEAYLYKNSNSLYNSAYFNDDIIKLIDDYTLIYGENNAEIIACIKHVMFNYGIALDATYTGKAFWGMNEYIKKQNIKNENILFLHTGGTPLFFDELNNIFEEKLNE